MHRSLVTTSVVALAALVLAACGGGEDAGSVRSGADAVVKVDGKDVSGLDLSTVSCVRQGENFVIGTGGANGAVAVTMTTHNPPVLQTVGITADGTTLAVGGGVGEATVRVEGTRYTITGTAQGASIADPAAGVVRKPFEIAVTCR
ncbi:lipoprotein LpqH [Tsukamurella sp. DT100]|uniref:lipoprotein LpqH n=1 Tax=Tsukamurella sp. DT100 TaxID=3393415 RepID=UPI003CE8A463